MDFDRIEGYEGVNLYMSSRSDTPKFEYDVTTKYFARGLYQRIKSGTIFKLPKSWARSKTYFKNVVFCNGYIGVVNTAKFGTVPIISGYKGYGLWLQPTQLVVSQPLLQGTFTIGKDAELIKLTDDYMGVLDIVWHFATRLSVAIASLDCSLINERLSIIAGAKNKANAEALKIIYEKISAGQPFVVFDKELKSESLDGNDEPIWMFSQDVASQYISDKILNDIATIIAQFDKEVGIAAVGEKKERLIESEVKTQNDDSCARASTWFESLSDSFDLVNETFPELNLSFTMKYGGEVHEYGDTVDTDRNAGVRNESV